MRRRGERVTEWLDAHPNAFGAISLALAAVCAAAWVWALVEPAVGTSGRGRRTEALFGLPVATVFLLVLAIHAFGQPAVRAERSGLEPEHSTAVLDLDEFDRPDEGDDPPRYVARCECGWVGDPHREEADAREEARAHTA